MVVLLLLIHCLLLLLLFVGSGWGSVFGLFFFFFFLFFLFFFFFFFLLCELSFPSSFEINLMGRRELFALLLLYSWCFVTLSVMWLFLKMLGVGLQCVIVEYPDYTHLFFKNYLESL